MEKISRLRKICKKKNSTKNTLIPFIQIHLLLTPFAFYSICMLWCMYAYVYIFSEPLEGKTHTSWPFTLTECVCLKNRDILLYNPKIVTSFSKLNIDSLTYHRNSKLLFLSLAFSLCFCMCFILYIILIQRHIHGSPCLNVFLLLGLYDKRICEATNPEFDKVLLSYLLTQLILLPPAI